MIGVRVFSRENGDDLSPGVNTLVRVYGSYGKYQLEIKLLDVGNSVVSTILPEEDMPFLPNGQPLDIILNLWGFLLV